MIFTTENSVANSAPGFVPGPDLEVDEDAPGQTYLHWASEIHPGPADGPIQRIRFELTNKDSTLFAVQPQIAPSGTLTFTPAHGAYGSTVVTAVAIDDGDADDRDASASDPVDFVITIYPVNDPPVFENRGDVVATNEPGLVSISGWAYHLGPGSQFEVGQTFTFVAANDAPGMFARQPAVDAEGTLTFEPAPGVRGTAIVTLVLRDSGGVDRGGSDVSSPATFAISIFGDNRGPIPIAQGSPGCWLSRFPTNIVVISPNQVDAMVRLDGSKSSDPDDDELGYGWFIDEGPIPSAAEAVVVERLEVGHHTALLSVSDGQARVEAPLQVEIITISDAIEALDAEVGAMALNRKAASWLRSPLARAGIAFERGRLGRGVRELVWFELRVRALVARQHPGAAAHLLRASGQILAAVYADASSAR